MLVFMAIIAYKVLPLDVLRPDVEKCLALQHA